MATNFNADDEDDEQNPQSSRSKAHEESKNILTDPMVANRANDQQKLEENPLENPE